MLRDRSTDQAPSGNGSARAERNAKDTAAATAMVTERLRIAWRRLAAGRADKPAGAVPGSATGDSAGRGALVPTTPVPAAHVGGDAVTQKLGAELYAMTVRAVEAEVTVERLEQELAHARADTERVALSDLSARQRASRDELAAFEAALKPMTELGQSLIKWAESWGHELQATLIDDLERLDAAMRPLNHGMHKTYRDAGAPYGDTEEGMLRWWGEQADRADDQAQPARPEPVSGNGHADGGTAATSGRQSLRERVRRIFAGSQ